MDLQVMELCDALFGWFRAWRRLRGGRWECLAASVQCPVDAWERVDLFHARRWPKVIAREDYRR